MYVCIGLEKLDEVECDPLSVFYLLPALTQPGWATATAAGSAQLGDRYCCWLSPAGRLLPVLAQPGWATAAAQLAPAFHYPPIKA